MVLGGQLLNQRAPFGVDAWSSGTSRTTPPPSREPVAIPSVDGRGLNQPQRLSPPRPHASQDQPEETINLAKAPIRTSEGRPTGDARRELRAGCLAISSTRSGSPQRSARCDA